ncbi:UNVERIFIED_CONTAM: NACHT, LRR and PYD domains-containing protein 14 [Siphonaria sp. JEL0065]|nr:NACHT, LRR and PYD domains-containing protein 14 [Siphonaria sp. JEL0065]
MQGLPLSMDTPTATVLVPPPLETPTDTASYKWVGTSPLEQDAVGSPEHWVDQSDDSKPEDLNGISKSQVDHWLHDLAPLSLAEDLAFLREDLKVLALQLSSQQNLRKAETDKRYVEFFESLAKASSAEPSAVTQEADTTSDSAAARAVPRYMVTLNHAETILRAISEKQANLHAEEFMFIMKSRVQIRDLEITLAAKERELEAAKLRLSEAEGTIESLQAEKSQLSDTPIVQVPPVVVLPTVSLPARTSNETLPTRSSSESFLSVSGILSKIRRGSILFESPHEPATASGIPGSFPQASKEVDAKSSPTIAVETSVSQSTVIKPVGLPDDPAAFISARGEWFESAETYDFFISYRVATDAPIAMELYFRLKDQRIIDQYGQSRQVRVYWDKECLKKGQDWHDGFVKGLKNSRCVLMLASPGAMEGMKKSNKYADNVLLEWETAVMAGQKGICVPQPVFINNAKLNIRAIDAILKFKGSDECPKLRPELEDAHKHSAFTTLSAIMQLQGVQLDVAEVSWSIPDMIAALQTFSPLQMAYAAKRCAAEASFFNYYPDQKFDSTAFDLEFLTSNDLKEVFGYTKPEKDGILQHREKELKELRLSFRKSPSLSNTSMTILSAGLKQNFEFFTHINLKGSNVRNRTASWNLFAEGLKENSTLLWLDLSDNDICGIPALHEAIRDHKSLTNVLVGSGFDPLPLVRGHNLSFGQFYKCTGPSLKLIVELCKLGNPVIDDLQFYDENNSLGDDAVPAELGSFLAEFTGMTRLTVGSSTPTLLDALVTCVRENPVLRNIQVIGKGNFNQIQKKSDQKQKKADKEKRGINSVGGKKKQALPWVKALCAALEAREQSEKSKIWYFELNQVGLGDEDFMLLGNVLPKMTEMGFLVLDGNSMSTLSASTIFKAISSVGPDSKLSTISLEKNDIGPGCAADIYRLITRCPNLTSLRIGENPLGDEGVISICEAISTNPQLAQSPLSLRKTNMLDAGAQAVSKMLQNQNVKISELDISENDITNVGVAALGDALKSQLCLTSLTMNGLNCGPDGFTSFFDALKRPDCPITRLDVSGCDLGDAGTFLLLDAIGNKESLIFYGNNIQGSPELNKLISSSVENGGLRQVGLVNNPWGLEFLVSLSSSVASYWENKRKDEVSATFSKNDEDAESESELNEFINLEGCYIGNEGAKAVLSCISTWKNGIVIVLSDCDLDDSIIAILIESIKVSAALQGYISLKDNNITEVGFGKLLDWTETLTDIFALYIDLNGNPISNDWLIANSKRIECEQCPIIYDIPGDVSADYFVQNYSYNSIAEDEEGEEEELEGGSNVEEEEGDEGVQASEKDMKEQEKVEADENVEEKEE